MQVQAEDKKIRNRSLRRSTFAAFVALAVFAVMAPARAVLKIEITQGLATGIAIAVVPFAWQGKAKLPHDISAIVTADLARSGRFAPIAQKGFVSTPHEDRDVVFKDWRVLKAEALVIGSVRELARDSYQVEFRLYDVFKQKQLAGYRYVVTAGMLRMVAHQIADIVYEKLTGTPGAFNTRIAYITREPNGRKDFEYRLQVADSDGYGPTTIVKTTHPMLSPAWSPDGKWIAYVSFEQRRPKVFIQRLADGHRELLAEFSGINSAPAWSPDGKQLALTLSKDGNPDIFVMDIDSRRLRRVTDDSAIDTEPSWAPDGKSLVFTSDRAGRPQIYRVRIDGGGIERLTFEGDYNARASFSPDGTRLTLVTAHRGRYHIATLRLADRSLQVLTDTPLDESPSFAPNGDMILYATELRGRGVLASVSSDGRVRQLFTEQGDVREPAWSPYNRDLQSKE